MGPQVISIGEVLFDVFGDIELLAGAPLNVIAHIHRLGHEVAFLSGVGKDEAGARAIKGMQALGLSTEWITQASSPTGRVEITLSNGEPTYTIYRQVAYEEIVVSTDALQKLQAYKPQWLYYGTLAQCAPTTHQTTEMLWQCLPQTKRFYDLNIRPGYDSCDVVIALLNAASVVKLNKAELEFVCDLCGWTILGEEKFCRQLQERFSLDGVCVTRGEGGASLLHGDVFVERKAPTVEVVDTVGAGDAFAAALLHGLCEGWMPEQIVHFGNSLGSHVATQRGAIPPMSKADLHNLMSL